MKQEPSFEEQMEIEASRNCDHDINRDRASFRLGVRSAKEYFEAKLAEDAELKKLWEELQFKNWASMIEQSNDIIDELRNKLAAQEKAAQVLDAALIDCENAKDDREVERIVATARAAYRAALKNGEQKS